MIQDLVITICVILFAYALVPQIIKNYKEKRCTITCQTSVITYVCMFAIGGAFLSLGLTFSFIMSYVTGVLWLVLFIQRIKYGG